jgi:hypothetical protein
MPDLCVICNIHFSKKANYDRHLLSQKHQKRKKSSHKMFQCKTCSRYFTTKSNCDAHTKICLAICDTKIDNICLVDEIQMNSIIEKEQLQIQIQSQQLEITELRKQVTTLLDKITPCINTHNDNSTNTTNIETQNIIVVNSFGNENVEYLTDKIVCKLIHNAPFTCIPQLIEKIHFDPDHPENHNIKITNKKMNYAEIVRNNKWITANKKQVIDDVIQHSYNILDEKYGDNKETMSEKRQERFENFQNKYETEDEELIRNIKNEVDLTLINGTNNVHR